jgi:hypothetical protein
MIYRWLEGMIENVGIFHKQIHRQPPTAMPRGFCIAAPLFLYTFYLIYFAISDNSIIFALKTKQ